MSSMVPQAAEDSTAFILQVVGGNRGAANTGGTNVWAKITAVIEGIMLIVGNLLFLTLVCVKWWGQGLCFVPHSQLHELALRKMQFYFCQRRGCGFWSNAASLK